MGRLKTGMIKCGLIINGKSKKWIIHCLYVHVSAVRKQLVSSAAAPNRFCVSDITCCIIAGAKLIQTCLMHVQNHTEQWHFSHPVLDGHLIPTCHNLFLSILTVTPPPSPFCSCSVSLTRSLRPLMKCNFTTESLVSLRAASHARGLLWQAAAGPRCLSAFVLLKTSGKLILMSQQCRKMNRCHYLIRCKH